jgi:hypothetical protein
MDDLSRRGLLTGAGALVAAGTLGVPTATARTLSLPTSKRFNMSATTNEFFRSRPLHDATVMQSFAFDTPNNRLFAAQLRGGSGTNSGDLAVTQLDFAGNELG